MCGGKGGEGGGKLEKDEAKKRADKRDELKRGCDYMSLNGEDRKPLQRAAAKQTHDSRKLKSGRWREE